MLLVSTVSCAKLTKPEMSCMTEIAQLPNYNDVEKTLANISFPLHGAECHGLVSGVISAANDVSSAKKALLGLLTDSDNTTITITEAKASLTDLCDITAAQLADINFRFQLLLPHDDASLTTRSAAISSWCQGFISGLGEGQIETSLKAKSELAETIEDFIAITQLDVQAIQGTEDEEVSFNELVEYVRFAVMTIYTDLLLANKNTVTPNTLPRINREK